MRRGPSPGPIAQKKGKFELADGGTIFLDEIGDMPPATQAKLLRVLQEKEFERVGGTQPIRVDVRFIAATNKNLPEMVKTGAFREDLFYRLNVFSLHLPPLRERREDIPLLIEHFLEKSGKDLTVSHQAMQLLLGYGWPGNIRELQNVIERAAVIADRKHRAGASSRGPDRRVAVIGRRRDRMTRRLARRPAGRDRKGDDHRGDHPGRRGPGPGGPDSSASTSAASGTGSRSINIDVPSLKKLQDL